MDMDLIVGGLQADQKARGLDLRGSGWSIWNMGGDCMAWGRAVAGKECWFQIQHPDDLCLPESANDVHVMLIHDADENFSLDFRGTLADALAWVKRYEAAANASGVQVDDPDHPVDFDYVVLSQIVADAQIEQVRAFLDGFYDNEWPADESTDEEARAIALEAIFEGIETGNVENLLAARGLLAAKEG
jgi:hypothetical protein